MKIGIISDIHGNLEALRSVYTALDDLDCGYLVCLGDIVGYGPSPNECVDLVRERCDAVLMGNHDCATVGQMDIAYFNPYAREALFWTRSQLSKENFNFLRDLPLTCERDSAIFVHSTPFQPHMWHYVVTPSDAMFQLAYFDQQVCFIGHSHQPLMLSFESETTCRLHAGEVTMEPEVRYLVNVGSVGQPRDGIPDSCFAVFDEEQSLIRLYRQPYAVGKTQEMMRKSGIHPFLIERLEYGR
ncbi:MAG: metallophosphoesterase family protein [Candidatus Schekmanbacteria bacterium]|nr:metallophosphoesterase family protein [Candidatus Schekmanbacteria bacterium]